MFVHFDAPQEHLIFQKLQHLKNIDFEHHVLEQGKESGSSMVSVTSLWSCSSIGVFVIGENPRAGMPSCLTKRESVVEDKISGLDSFPPAEVMAFSNMDHHGFDSFVAVNMGRPATSVTGPFCISCMTQQGISGKAELGLVSSMEMKVKLIFHLVGQVFMSWCPFLFDSSFDLFNIFSWREAEIKANLCF
jgi:hypothetical protein